MRLVDGWLSGRGSAHACCFACAIAHAASAGGGGSRMSAPGRPFGVVQGGWRVLAFQHDALRFDTASIDRGDGPASCGERQRRRGGSGNNPIELPDTACVAIDGVGAHGCGVVVRDDDFGCGRCDPRRLDRLTDRAGQLGGKGRARIKLGTENIGNSGFIILKRTNLEPDISHGVFGAVGAAQA